MLNDYEIKRNDKILAVLKLLISALGLYIIINLSPSFVELLDESRPSYAEDVVVRVIANSNTEKDQQMKKQVVADMQDFLKESSVKEEELVPSIQTFIQQQYPHAPIQLKSGDNLIPPKLIMRTFYPQVSTNSLVVVIGEGRGENWFCSAFPSICDKPEKTEEDEEKQKVRFKFIEWLKEKFF
ncbi:stage II sporulation protein R [Lysinibacillus odysseyi]|uniref:Stage II sporulation protein R n=1 Tax=Lysinibacillus odysseyi 34hs-1 = NBRC 100172 TaxID=1220589 RepID=A0A0A3JM55_9BACI|nr:stage II sporulation protein R [Lysinibacillus odysseyi]KGR88097.1 hypothetical protein CD32_02430 [Lysinibacillus odysseyi 34hs-1 = NBRC 100172]